MKPFRTLILPLLFTQFIYADTKEPIPPKSIEIALCKKLSKQGCNQQRKLKFDNEFKLNNHQTLFFAHMERSDSLYAHGYSNIPIIVNKQHQWKIINHTIEAEIQNVLQDPYGGIWIHALWMIEGVSPLLYYSKNGQQWQKITLPKEENSHGTFEDLEICFQKKAIQLRFNNLDYTEKTKIWEGKYRLVIDTKNSWKKMDYKQISKEKCSNNFPLNNKIISSEIKLQETPKAVTNTIPLEKAIIHFSLQLGTFKQKNSIDMLYAQMKNIPNTVIQRKFITEGETIYKLYIGYFNTYNEAKNELFRLRNNYPNNEILKNAFITKFK